MFWGKKEKKKKQKKQRDIFWNEKKNTQFNFLFICPSWYDGATYDKTLLIQALESKWLLNSKLLPYIQFLQVT